MKTESNTFTLVKLTMTEEEAKRLRDYLGSTNYDMIYLAGIPQHDVSTVSKVTQDVYENLVDVVGEGPHYEVVNLEEFEIFIDELGRISKRRTGSE